MTTIGKIIALALVTIFFNCNSDASKSNSQTSGNEQETLKTDTLTTHLKPFKADLPTIGLLMYNGVLQSEVIATSDVFAKPSLEGHQLFNVITIAETDTPITTEEGMRFVPDYTFDNCPKLVALFVPSAYDMYA